MDISNVTQRGTPVQQRANASESEVAPASQSQAEPQAEDRTASSGENKPVMSPVVRFDGDTGEAILQFRDANSGTTEFQLPSKTTREYARHQHDKAEPGADQGGHAPVIA